MSCKYKKARTAAHKAAEEALEQGTNAFDEAVSHVTPIAKQATRQVADLSHQAADLGRQAADYVVPAFEDARERITPKVEEVVERLQPAVTQAYETVSDKVQHEWYPKLQEFWDEANENPSVIEASKRGRSVVAALRGDLQLPEAVAVPEVVVDKPRKHRVLGRLFTILGIAAAVAAIVVVVRAVLGNDDDGWSPQQPMRPDQDVEDDSWGESPFADEDETVLDDESAAEEDMIAEGSPATEPEAGLGALEGAYVGTEPPAGYVIKGNERSMKYHTPQAAGYERTNADIWFNSEEAAVAAGFTKAQR